MNDSVDCIKEDYRKYYHLIDRCSRLEFIYYSYYFNLYGTTGVSQFRVWLPSPTTDYVARTGKVDNPQCELVVSFVCAGAYNHMNETMKHAP